MTQYELESEIVRRDNELRQLRALLRECQDAVRIAASAEEDHGAINRARELDALSAKIKEVLG